MRSKAVIGVQCELLAGVLDRGDGLLGDLDELGAAARAVAGDVEHEAAAVAGGRLHREAGQLLEGVEHLGVVTDEATGDSTLLGVDDRHCGAVTIDVDVDVTVEVADVEEVLEEVCRDLSFLLEVGRRGLGRSRVRGRRSALRCVLARLGLGCLPRTPRPRLDPPSTSGDSRASGATVFSASVTSLIWSFLSWRPTPSSAGPAPYRRRSEP